MMDVLQIPSLLMSKVYQSLILFLERHPQFIFPWASFQAMTRLRRATLGVSNNTQQIAATFLPSFLLVNWEKLP
uniref:Uncharacterized protein n=1 Tax=Octopus bimaculoides TaxID=37653 RepID=A0A0L8G1B1_OCTBM